MFFKYDVYGRNCILIKISVRICHGVEPYCPQVDWDWIASISSLGADSSPRQDTGNWWWLSTREWLESRGLAEASQPAGLYCSPADNRHCWPAPEESQSTWKLDRITTHILFCSWVEIHLECLVRLCSGWMISVKGLMKTWQIPKRKTELWIWSRYSIRKTVTVQHCVAVTGCARRWYIVQTHCALFLKMPWKNAEQLRFAWKIMLYNLFLDSGDKLKFIMD